MRPFLPCLLTALTISLAAHAQPYKGYRPTTPTDPDWPCDQLLVPKLSAGSYWAGTIPAVPQPNWRDDPSYSRMVETLADRATPDDQAVKLAVTYIRHQPVKQRARAAAALFGAVVVEANDQRDLVITRLDELSRRQKNLSATIDRIEAKLAAIPATATGDQAQLRTELTGDRDLRIQGFQDTQHSITFACAVPGDYDRRLGALARALQTHP